MITFRANYLVHCSVRQNGGLLTQVHFKLDGNLSNLILATT